MNALNTNITIIAYKRPDILLTVLQTLSVNHGVEQYPLSIYIDGPRENNIDEHEKVMATVEVAKNFLWKNEKKVIASPENLGLRRGVRFAIDSSLQYYDSTIVIEDDIVTSPYFIQFMEDGLKKYKDHDKVGAICGYCHNFSRSYFNPTQAYFLKFFSCWGWATWRTVWDKMCWNFDTLIRMLNTHSKEKKILDLKGDFISGILYANQYGTLNTWAAAVAASLRMNDLICLYPPETLCNNIGWRITRHADNTHSYSPTNIDPPMAYTRFSMPEHNLAQSSRPAWKAYSKFFYPPYKRYKKYQQMCAEKIKQSIFVRGLMKSPTLYKCYTYIKHMLRSRK